MRVLQRSKASGPDLPLPARTGTTTIFAQRNNASDFLLLFIKSRPVRCT
jgi:hypothetical protein